MELRKLFAFGTGAGIEVRGNDLVVALSKVRPSGVEALAAATIHAFRERPAAEWGAEYAQFLKRHGAGHLSATVVLPRRDVIVRRMALPGIDGADLAAAIGYQIESLHPYGEDEIVYGWERISDRGAVILGIVRRSALDAYMDRFSEAGVKVASLTFSAAVWRAAARLFTSPPATGFLALGYGPGGEIEVYGESPSMPVFSAEFDLPRERAVALAAAELRLPPDTEALPLEQIVPAPAKSGNLDSSPGASALPYAASLAGACPRLAPAANLLPEERRITTSRAMFVPVAALAVVLLVMCGVLLGYSAYGEQQYLATLRAEIARLEPQAKKAAALDRSLARADARVRVLEEFRSRAKTDLDALQELTRILEPPVWTNQVILMRDAAILSGEAEQAAPLLKILDASPFFQKSGFLVSIVKAEKMELFRIRTERERR